MAIGAKQLLGGLATVALLALVAPAAAAAGTPALSAHGSVQQVYVLGASPGERLSLLDRRGRVVLGAVAGPLGGAIFRGVAPGSGYSVRPAAGGSPTSPTVTVLPDRSAPPSTRIYNQRIPASGYGYLTTRDGTKLAIDVRLPPGKGPFPTLVEYAGYGYANPAGAESGLSPLVAPLLGFAVVDV